MTPRELLTATYRAFNARDIDAVLAVMNPHVDWPNGMEGGHVQGRQVVRDPGGRILADQVVQHVYALCGGLITRMEIRKP